MYQKSCFAIASIIIVLLQSSQAARILGVFTTPSYSHVIVHDSLMQELARRGHEVTVVGHFPPKLDELPKTYRFVHIPYDNDNYSKTMGRWMKAAEEGTFSLAEAFSFMHSMIKQFEDALHHPEFVKLKSEQFDLLVLGWFNNEFQIGIGAHFKCPIIINYSSKASTVTRKIIGNPGTPAFNPSLFMNTKGPMTFFQRFLNFGIVSMEYIVFSTLDYFVQSKLYAKNFPPDQYPSYDEVKKNISLIFVNQHFSEGTIETSLPGLIEVGGMHIKSASPLPKDIQEFLDGAEHGAIFFSLGSNIKSSQLSAERRDAILFVFSQLKERVLWKWEDDHLPSKPDNVMINKWFPQNDVLAHPKTKLFISHCGAGSVFEAKYNGVPILGIPVFADQPSNAKIIEQDGWGASIQLPEINELTFSRVINEMLRNESYANVAKRLSELYRDRPMKALDTAVYWTEYVLKYNGARHIQSPAVHLNFFQYYTLDVIATYLLIIYSVIKITKFIVCFVFRKCKSKLFKKIKQD